MISKQMASFVKATIIIIFLIIGVNYIYQAQLLISESFSPDPPVIFLKTLWSNDSLVGLVTATLTPTQSFVVGLNISADIKIGLPNAANTSYFAQVQFQDALTLRDIPPYTWQQDFYLDMSEVQVVGSEKILTLNNVTLVYAHDGIYGLNVIIYETYPSKLTFYFPDLIQIKPLTYLDDKLKSNLAFAMNYEILGLTLIMVAPVIIQLVGLVEDATSKNRLAKDTSSQHPNKEEINKPSVSRGKNLDKEERELQIKLAQLNAGLQTYLAVIFGTIAAAVALLVFGYQIAFESYPQITIKTVIAIAFWAVAACMAYFAYRTVPKLKACLKEINELK